MGRTTCWRDHCLQGQATPQRTMLPTWLGRRHRSRRSVGWVIPFVGFTPILLMDSTDPGPLSSLDGMQLGVCIRLQSQNPDFKWPRHRHPCRNATFGSHQVLEHEASYLEGLPSASMYERSFMHRDVVTCVTVAASCDFLMTGSADGHLKFWKKRPGGLEFVKHFRAHKGPIDGEVAA